MGEGRRIRGRSWVAVQVRSLRQPHGELWIWNSLSELSQFGPLWLGLCKQPFLHQWLDVGFLWEGHDLGQSGFLQLRHLWWCQWMRSVCWQQFWSWGPAFQIQHSADGIMVRFELHTADFICRRSSMDTWRDDIYWLSCFPQGISNSFMKGLWFMAPLSSFCCWSWAICSGLTEELISHRARLLSCMFQATSFSSSPFSLQRNTDSCHSTLWPAVFGHWGCRFSLSSVWITSYPHCQQGVNWG